MLLRHGQHRLGGQRRVGAATATVTWWFLLSIIWWTTTILFEIQQVPVPSWCCSSYSLSPSRFTVARPNPNQLLLSVRPSTKRYAAAEEDETEERRLIICTESNAKEWNATSTDDDNDRYSLVNPISSSSNRKQSHLVQQWNPMFEKLKEYKTIHGDCLVPSKYKCDDRTPLGTWVVYQRRAPQYTSEDGKWHGEQRRQALDSIGFVWIVNEQLRQLSPETGQYATTKKSTAIVKFLKSMNVPMG
jgi:Helicase associated domain